MSARKIAAKLEAIPAKTRQDLDKWHRCDCSNPDCLGQIGYRGSRPSCHPYAWWVLVGYNQESGRLILVCSGCEPGSQKPEAMIISVADGVLS